MEVKETLEIILSYDDIEGILKSHVEALMEAKGYQLVISKNEEGPIPDLIYVGNKNDERCIHCQNFHQPHCKTSQA